MKRISFLFGGVYMTRESILQLTGFRLVGAEKKQRAFGMIAGYPVLATELKGRLVLAFSATNTPDRKEFRAIRDGLKEDATLSGNVVATKDEAGNMSVSITSKDEAEMKRLYEQTKLRFAETVRGMENFTPPTVCHICQGEGADTLAQMGGALTIVHRSCLQNLKQEQTERVENIQTKGSGVIQGLIGGLVGGVIGAAPAFIALHFFERFIFVLFAFIPFGAYYGWKLLGGKLTRVTTAFVVIYSLFLSLVTEVVATHFVLADIFGDQIRLMDTVNYYFTPDVFFEYFARDVGLALVSAVVGIFIAWGSIRKTDKAILSETESVINESVPIERV